MTDGELVLWALGEAGWFEIRPAPHYKEIYDNMVEAVQLLYFITDIYEESRKIGGVRGVQLVFQEVRLNAYTVANRARKLMLDSTPKTSDFLAIIRLRHAKRSTSIMTS